MAPRVNLEKYGANYGNINWKNPANVKRDSRLTNLQENLCNIYGRNMDSFDDSSGLMIKLADTLGKTRSHISRINEAKEILSDQYLNSSQKEYVLDALAEYESHILSKKGTSKEIANTSKVLEGINYIFNNYLANEDSSIKKDSTPKRSDFSLGLEQRLNENENKKQRIFDSAIELESSRIESQGSGLNYLSIKEEELSKSKALEERKQDIRDRIQNMKETPSYLGELVEAEERIGEGVSNPNYGSSSDNSEVKTERRNYAEGKFDKKLGLFVPNPMSHDRHMKTLRTGEWSTPSKPTEKPGRLKRAGGVIGCTLASIAAGAVGLIGGLLIGNYATSPKIEDLSSRNQELTSEVSALGEERNSLTEERDALVLNSESYAWIIEDKTAKIGDLEMKLAKAGLPDDVVTAIAIETTSEFYKGRINELKSEKQELRNQLDIAGRPDAEVVQETLDSVMGSMVSKSEYEGLKINHELLSAQLRGNEVESQGEPVVARTDVIGPSGLAINSINGFTPDARIVESHRQALENPYISYVSAEFKENARREISQAKSMNSGENFGWEGRMAMLGEPVNLESVLEENRTTGYPGWMMKDRAQMYFEQGRHIEGHITQLGGVLSHANRALNGASNFILGGVGGILGGKEGKEGMKDASNFIWRNAPLGPNSMKSYGNLFYLASLGQLNFNDQSYPKDPYVHEDGLAGVAAQIASHWLLGNALDGLCSGSGSSKGDGGFERIGGEVGQGPGRVGGVIGVAP